MVAVMLQAIFLTKEIPSSSAATLVMIIVSRLPYSNYLKSYVKQMAFILIDLGVK